MTTQIKHKLKLIWYLLTAKVGTIDIGYNKFLGGFHIGFSLYGWKAFRIRWRIFYKKWRGDKWVTDRKEDRKKLQD